jgi:hypothetical protein
VTDLSKITVTTQSGVFKSYIPLCFIRFVVSFNDVFKRLEIFEPRFARREKAIDDFKEFGKNSHCALLWQCSKSLWPGVTPVTEYSYNNVIKNLFSHPCSRENRKLQQ